MDKVQVGRPREFDTDEALQKAVVVFWEQGYDGASLTDLTERMGISRKSMYAAFGNKEQLFRKALQRYTELLASYVLDALEAPTAREVGTVFLHGAALANTRPGLPRGCLGVQGALAVGATGAVARDTLAAWRALGQEYLRERFQRAVDEGDLPADSEPEVLARYLMTVSNGMSVQASGGATREELQQVADTALRNWPPA